MSQSLRILLIADDPEVIRRIGHGLQRQDSGLILIEGADSLATARRRLGAGSYDLALVDLALGQGDGLHLLSDLHEIAPELPVVALAANGAGPDAAACLALGAQDRLAPDAMDSAGLLDRLQSATARARAGLNSRRRSQRIAGSLGAAGDLAWHYEHGESDIWLAAADPAAWQLPAPECRESLDALRARIHPDDRELALRQVEELLVTDQPWQVEARVRVGGGAYRWCLLRGRSQLDARGRLERAAGVLSDAQRQQKKARELEQARRFLRAVFDSQRAPQAVLDSSAVITDFNQAWGALEEPACHAGSAFAPGRRFIDPPEDLEAYGDLELAELSRGVRQVLGGVIDQYACEYGDGTRRWRIEVTPLLNPGIAGALVRHEEITASWQREGELRTGLEARESDFTALQGPLFRLAADFAVQSANLEGEALGRAPVIGRDVLKVLPRAHAEVVGDALAALATGAAVATRDAVTEDGRGLRWLAATRRDGAGQVSGFLLHGLDISDLGSGAGVAQAAEATQAAETAQAAQAAVAAREAEQGRVVAELRAALSAAEAERRGLGEAFARAEKELASLREALASAETTADEAASQQAAEAEERARLEATLEAERGRHGETLAALSAAEQVPVRLHTALQRTRHELGAELAALAERLLEPLLKLSESDPAGQGSADADPNETN